MPNLERYPGLQSPLEQSKKIQEKIRPLRELRAQLETLDKLFGVETTLLPGLDPTVVSNQPAI
jgi:hypothetical protein